MYVMNLWRKQNSPVVYMRVRTNESGVKILKTPDLLTFASSSLLMANFVCAVGQESRISSRVGRSACVGCTVMPRRMDSTTSDDSNADLLDRTWPH